MKRFLVIPLIFFFLLASKRSSAWGAEGHAIVGRLAMHFVSDDVRKNILAILGDMPVDTAANWMDIMKSNPDYDFMRSWHYIDFPKAQPYTPGNEENIINRLLITYNELGHKNTLCAEQIRTDMLILMHLMGDLHMPLHTAYDDDLGGNKRMIQYGSLTTHNLHRFWDEDIISLTNITDEDCLKFYKGDQTDTIKGIDFVKWMKESRGLLSGVYDFPDFMLDKAYLDKNKIVVQKQLLLAGLRLAAILNRLFYTPAPAINFKELTSKYNNGIDVVDAMNNIGKKVTVCAKVYGIRSTAAITQINVGAKYPNSPLTVVIFGKNYPNFKSPPEELFKDKNICVKGKIEEYKGKAQIIVEQLEDIIIQ